MTRTENSVTFLRSEYKETPFTIKTVQLDIALNPARTIVVNRMQISKKNKNDSSSLVLHGQDQELISIRVNNEVITEYESTPDSLTLNNLPDDFELSITSACVPEKNTSLMGLYVSNGNFLRNVRLKALEKSPTS